MFLCSLTEELCPKEENDKTFCNFNFGHECIKLIYMFTWYILIHQKIFNFLGLFRMRTRRNIRSWAHFWLNRSLRRVSVRLEKAISFDFRTKSKLTNTISLHTERGGKKKEKKKKNLIQTRLFYITTNLGNKDVTHAP